MECCKQDIFTIKMKMKLHYMFSFLAHQLTNFDRQFFIELDLTCPDMQSKADIQYLALPKQRIFEIFCWLITYCYSLN